MAKKIVPEVVSTYTIKNQRIDQLSDGIFAIVMTLLAFDLRIPEVHGNLSDLQLLQILGNLGPVFLSYALTFALLFTYWRSHHFLVSVFAKNLTVGLANLNALFFLFIAVVPFSARLLGEYSYNHIAIIVYGLNVVCIGIVLLLMRSHIERSSKIEVANISPGDLRSSYIRVMVPIISAALAIALSNINTAYSMAFFAFGILFNIVPASSNLIHHFVDKLSNNEAIVE